MISHFLSIKGPDTLLARLPLWHDMNGLPQTVFQINYAPYEGKHGLFLLGGMLRMPCLVYPDTDLVIRLETAK